MKQSNYVTKNLNLRVSGILKKLKDECKLYNSSNVANGHIDTVKEVYFDTSDYTILNAGGFCRLVTHKSNILNKTSTIRYFLDIKKDNATPCKRMELYTDNLERDFNTAEVKKISNLNLDIVPVLELSSNEQHFDLQFLDIKSMLDNACAVLDFIVSTTTIEAIEEIPVFTDVMIYSLQDISSKYYNKEIATSLKDYIDKTYESFDKVMQSLNLTPTNKNKYQTIEELLNINTTYKKNV